MPRYIDADKVNEEIDTIQTSLESNDDKVWHKNKPYYKGLAMARSVINEQPTADVVPRSEVVKIFEEIGKILYEYDKTAERDKSEYGELIVGDIGYAISELKNKYTEGKK